MKQKFNVITSTCIPLPLENVDTDQIIPARFLKAIDKEGMGDNLFRDWRYNADGTPKPDFVMNDPSYSGVILVAGKNFGSGSSREHAPIAIKAAGVDAVIAKSFARIFYRNSINTGLAILECPEAVDAIKNGDVVSVDTETGTITDETTGESFTAQPFPPFIADIIEQGGLLNRTRHVLGLA